MFPRRWILGAILLLGAACGSTRAQPLPGTKLLTGSNDLAADMVSGLSRYLDREASANVARRSRLWASQSRAAGVTNPVQRFDSNRARFREVLGLTDPRDVRDPVTLRHSAAVTGTPPAPGAELAVGTGYRVLAVAWNVFRGVEGEGLLLVPDGQAKANVIAVPDCEWTPEQFAGLAPGLPPAEQLARRCAEQGCRVLVPFLILRDPEPKGVAGIRATGHSQRETLWRASYEMGRTVIGYELQKILAAADWLEATPAAGAPSPGKGLGVIGHGEGGLLALYAAAADTRFGAAYVSGYFGPREQLWREPIYRNVFGLLREFGDAEIGALVSPRWLWLENGRYPEIEHTDANGGAPGRLGRPDDAALTAEYARLNKLFSPVAAGLGNHPHDQFGRDLGRFLGALTGPDPGAGFPSSPAPVLAGALPDPQPRALRQYRQILEDTQWLMREGEYARQEFWKKADFTSAAGFTRSAAAYRGYFWTNVIGYLPPASVPPEPKTRWVGETAGVRRYEVVLEVHPDVFAYGILCLPPGLKAGERRPVVVCQHGLEGRPSDISDPAVQSPYYHQYGLRLAGLGFVTFAPQNPYIGNTRFRQVLHQAQPLGLTLWSFIVRQHEVITDWLAAQDFVDPQRIGFYGLSYGGKTAMRVPALVDRYCLSICSADYNEWIWKNTSARSSYSYLFNNEYDMPEWNLGNTYNYAEMSWLIFPRPFMVERGHDDGVAPDEWVAYEYAKTRRHYVKLGQGDRTEIEFFDGPHSIHGVGTFAFLQRHLNWPAPR